MNRFYQILTAKPYFRLHISLLLLCFCFFGVAPQRLLGDESTGGTNPLSAPTGQARSVDVESSIKQLSAKSFLQREDAAQRLLFIGAAAEDALVTATNGADREVRDRSRRILKLIREEKRNAWLVQFRDGKATDDVETRIPGWSKFTKRYGDTVEGREVYAEILKDDWDLVANCVAGESDVQRQTVLMRNYQALGQKRINYRNSEYGTSLALFFLYSEYPQSAGPWLHQYLFDYMRNAQVSQRLQGRKEHPVVRRLVSDWVIAASGPSLNEQNAQLALQNARIYGLQDASRVIAERILTETEVIPVMRRNAMESIVVRSDRSQLKLIEPFLEDRTILGTSKNRTRQLRDVALACVMHLKGYDVNKIGVRLRPNSAIVAFDYQSLGFITEGDRAKAFETFRKLEEKRARKQ